MKNKSNKIICFEEYVTINGISQYLFHSGKKADNPVMLFLHGGPGGAFSIVGHLFQEKWEDIFTIVHWDQRGAGKTLTKNPDKLPTIDLLHDDLRDIIHYLKEKYNQQKIVLLGHSWGSVLGSTFVRQYPEDVAYYIGVGQVIGMLENERVGYEKVRELILQANDTKSLRILDEVGEYPTKKFDAAFMKKCNKIRKLQAKYKLSIEIGFTIWKGILKSPVIKFSDFFAFLKASKANKKLMEFLETYDLKSGSAEYQVPVYYILGGNDWQAPFVIAKEYFNQIIAPDKKLFILPGAGHFTMFDQPQLFFDTLYEIKSTSVTN